MATPGTQGTPAAAPGVDRAAVQHAAVAVGIAFVLIGVLGFIPGITTNFDALAFAGHHSEAELFGLFNVSVLHNIVHLVFGVLGVALAKTFKAARGYLVVGGGIYLLLAVYGLVVAHASGANVVPVNTADNWLHLGLAAGMLALGLVLGRTPDVPRDMRHV